MSLEEKIRLFKKIGIKKLIAVDADKKLLNYSPAEFLQLLKTNFQIDEFVVGHDFAFGKNRKGNLKTLKAYGFSVNQVKPVLFKKKIVSTTLIKQLINSGEMQTVSLLMDKSFVKKD